MNSFYYKYLACGPAFLYLKKRNFFEKKSRLGAIEIPHRNALFCIKFGTIPTTILQLLLLTTVVQQQLLLLLLLLWKLVLPFVACSLSRVTYDLMPFEGPKYLSSEDHCKVIECSGMKLYLLLSYFRPLLNFIRKY